MPNHPDNIPTRITDPNSIMHGYSYSPSAEEEVSEHLNKNAHSTSRFRGNPPNSTDTLSTKISPNSRDCTHVSLVFETEFTRVFKSLKGQDAADWLKAMDACVSFCLVHGHNPFEEFFKTHSFEERITRKIK